MNASWRISLFGGLRAQRGEQVITRFRTQKTATLLAYLACFLPRSHPREVLIDLLWPDGSIDTGRHNLSVALSSLRRQLEPPGIRDGSVLITERLNVQLDPEAVTTDVREFEEALRSAEQADSSEARIDWLTRCVEWYRGELLPGYYEDWIQQEQNRLRALLLQVLEQMSQELERTAQFERALAYARRAVSTDPLREEAHRTVMRLYKAMNEPTAALRHYNELAALLKEELNMAPSAATRALAREIAAVVTDDNEPVVVPAGVNVVTDKEESPILTETAKSSYADNPKQDYEPVGGAVPLDSPFYVLRPADSEFRQAVQRGDSIVLVKGARQVGKTSLLARELQHARQTGARVVSTDFQLLSEAHLASADNLFQCLGAWIAEQLELDVRPSDAWEDGSGPGLNFRRFMRREVLSRVETRLVWGLDEVDRLFFCGFASEVFGLFRSWHNERALDPTGPWSRLTLAIAYATEAHLFISDLNQSPFNVGTRLALEDFTFDQVADLNQRYGSPLSSTEELARFYRVVGGHPFLVRRGLHEMVTRELPGPRQRPIDAFELEADREEGIFGDHLRRMLTALSRDPTLQDALCGMLQGEGSPTSESFFRLRSAGVLSGGSVDESRFRCELYAQFLKRHLV